MVRNTNDSSSRLKKVTDAVSPAEKVGGGEPRKDLFHEVELWVLRGFLLVKLTLTLGEVLLAGFR